MSTLTPNYNLIKPGVNDPTDQDLWGGYLNTDLDIIDTTMKSIADTAGRLPVGSLYFNDGDATNPATLLGYGTWTSFGQGRVILGVGSGTDSNGEVRAFTNGETGGEYKHSLSVSEMPAHAHPGSSVASPTLSGAGTINIGQSALYLQSGTIASQGGDTPHNNVQPYISVYIWKRTA